MIPPGYDCPRARRAISCSTLEVGTGACRTPVSLWLRYAAWAAVAVTNSRGVALRPEPVPDGELAQRRVVAEEFTEGAALFGQRYDGVVTVGGGVRVEDG